jgi:hypothetical protein
MERKVMGSPYFFGGILREEVKRLPKLFCQLLPTREESLRAELVCIFCPSRREKHASRGVISPISWRIFIIKLAND